MIFATVGTQLPFERFISALDRIAGRLNLQIVAQCYAKSPKITYLDQRPFLQPADFDRLAAESSVIVGHAGIGTILSAAHHKKPLVLFPRIAAKGEHRNEHQLATAQQFKAREGIYIAFDEEQLESLMISDQLVPFAADSGEETQRLIAAVSDFIG